jgi:hypothetical protein
MTRESDISKSPAAGKLRRPCTVALLSGATLGIYWPVWYYKINREMRDYGASHDDRELASSRPVRSLLAVIACPLSLFAPMISLVRTVGRLERVERLASGQVRRGTGLKVLLVGGQVSFVPSREGFIAISLLGIAACLTASALIQRRLNTAWRVSGTERTSRMPSAPVGTVAPLVTDGSPGTVLASSDLGAVNAPSWTSWRTLSFVPIPRVPSGRCE